MLTSDQVGAVLLAAGTETGLARHSLRMFCSCRFVADSKHMPEQMATN